MLTLRFWRKKLYPCNKALRVERTFVLRSRQRTGAFAPGQCAVDGCPFPHHGGYAAVDNGKRYLPLCWHHWQENCWPNKTKFVER